MFSILSIIILELFYLIVIFAIINELHFIKCPQKFLDIEQKHLRLANFEAMDLEGFAHLYPHPKPEFTSQEKFVQFCNGMAMLFSVLGSLISDQKFNFFIYLFAGILWSWIRVRFKPSLVWFKINGILCLILLLFIVYNHYVFHFSF